MSLVDVPTCRTKFTPGQVLRMRAYLHEAPVLSMVQPAITINNPPGNVTYWNTPQSPPSNIIVPSGQTLIINSPVEMSANSFIYVEKGAVLKVNATITGGCGKMWQGIIVDGDRDLLQTPQNQGYVGVYANGVIEHALCGIQVQGLLSNGFDNPAGGGGIVLVTAGKFRNCITGVKYASYLKQANKGKFLAAQFTVNADFRGGSAKVLFIDLAGTYGIFVSGGIYKDERATCAGREDRATAIQAYDAGFIATGAQFESLDFGAHVSTLSLNSGAFSITGNTFTDCFTSIFTSLASGYRISGNTFNMNRPDVCDNQAPQVIVGIRSVGLAAGVIIADNTFVKVGADQGLEILLGTDCNDIGTTNNLVMSNDFAFIDIANRSSGINGQSSNEGMIFSGLLYECNTHETSFEGDFLVENGRVRRVQGEETVDNDGNIISTASGNIFSNQDFKFRNNGVSLTYYYGTGQGEDPEFPLYSSGIEPFEATNNNTSCNSAETCPNPPCPEEWFNTTKEQFFQKKTQWKNKLLAFPGIASPSQQAIAGKAISQLRLDLDRDGRQIVQNYQLDTNLLKIDSVITWLSNLETYEADYHIARHYFFSGNTALADNLFATLPAKYSLNEERLGMHAKVLEVLDILRPFLTSNGELNPLSSGSIASLESYDLCDEAGYLARQILEKNGVSVTSDCIIPEPKPASSSSVNNIARRISGLSIFPNPVSETLNIFSPIENLTAIRLLDLMGRVVAQSEQSIGKQEVTFSVKNHKPGIYCLEAVSENGIAEYLKIVIYH
jgi:Secretion system C-terminal sorting domain